jgi:hypothetical protein
MRGVSKPATVLVPPERTADDESAHAVLPDDVEVRGRGPERNPVDGFHLPCFLGSALPDDQAAIEGLEQESLYALHMDVDTREVRGLGSGPQQKPVLMRGCVVPHLKGAFRPEKFGHVSPGAPASVRAVHEALPTGSRTALR